MRVFFLFVLPLSVLIGSLIVNGPSPCSFIAPVVVFFFGWGMWLLGSVYNAISGRRESLFD